MHRNVKSMDYDKKGRIFSITDAKGNTISFGYDENGNLTTTTDGEGNSITSEYDARNRITKQTDANGNETTYTYDGADRLIKVTDAYGNSYCYGYDANGNLVTVTDAKENVMHYSYDEVGRVKTVGEDTTQYSYDNTGLLTKVTDHSGTITYEYDNYSRLITKTDARGVTLSYSYDEVGRLKTFDNGFGCTSYEYDLLDRVVKVIDRNGQATIYEYDELGNRSAVRYANGTVVTYTYDACNRLKEEWLTDKDGNTISKYAYQLGKAGERTAITETDQQGVETNITYEYDKLNRLVTETIEKQGNKLTNDYTYDKVSNRTAKETTVTGDITALADIDSQEVKVVEGTTTYAYNALNQLVTEHTPDGETSYTYDDNGNLVKQSGETSIDYSYDKENHLLRATIQKGNNVTVEAYTYDYAGNRTSKTINESNTTYYVSDTSATLTMVVAETNEAGEEIASYTRGEELLSMEKGGQICYYLYDGHGSVRALTNEAGEVTDQYSYDAYGNLLEKEGSTENEFLYTGEQYNANTGLYYLRARYMNPSAGSFISMDSYQGSIYEPVTLHKYLYANANPVMYTDPSGYMGMLLATTEGACLSVSDAQNNNTIFIIGMRLMAQVRALKVVEAVSYLSAIAITGIGTTAALNGASNIVGQITAKILDNALPLICYVVVTAEMKAVQDMVEKLEVEKYRGYSVYLLRDSLNEDKVMYVGITNDPVRREAEHKNENNPANKKHPKKTGDKYWEMQVVYTGLTKEEARTMEQSLICIYTIQALSNARYEMSKKNVENFTKELERTATLLKVPYANLYHLVKREEW